MPEHTGKPLKPDAASADQSKYLIHSRLEIAAILARWQSRTMSRPGISTAVTTSSSLRCRGEARAEHGAHRLRARRRRQPAARSSQESQFRRDARRIKIQFAAESLRPAARRRPRNFRHGDARDAAASAAVATISASPRRSRGRSCASSGRRPGSRARRKSELRRHQLWRNRAHRYHDQAGFEAGARFHRCRVFLPELGEISTDIGNQEHFRSHGQKRHQAQARRMRVRRDARARPGADPALHQQARTRAQGPHRPKLNQERCAGYIRGDLNAIRPLQSCDFARTRSRRADRRLRTDEKHIRAQSTILYESHPKPPLLLSMAARDIRRHFLCDAVQRYWKSAHQTCMFMMSW